ncbi:MULTISPECIES: ATP-binding protein [unclassified Streptomyces]|uniref:ATP-binding protein n=1 Tax=unclassified Streptomyces TaxID=2593676 RepID=UPI00225A3D15|nr:MULTISPECIES: ATP-binding protein [unclassified Streptomyces]MCX4990093.1 ATP-binding protein [Streptomyces sp. NBC_00568]MCX5004677.1 ATP-binding protein [Streptomyces sp. NBC_00638]
MHEYTSTARVWGLTCPGFPEEVSRARRWTRDILRDSPLAEDAELIVSELSANAILHTASGKESGSFHLALAVSSQVIALSVTDDGGTGSAPAIEHQDQEAEHGRGLGMVSVIAHRVVVHDSDGGHTVTAELFTGARRGGHPC